MDFRIKTYDWDVALFRDLGLPLFDGIPSHALYGVGTVKVGDSTVTLWVEPMPAMFWTAEIETPGERRYKVTTGSGSLSDFWPSIKKIAEGMLVVEEIRE